MQMEPLEVRAATSNKLGRAFTRFLRDVRPPHSHAAGSSTEMLDEAFAVYSRFDKAVPKSDKAMQSGSHGAVVLQSAARDLLASISAQLESIDHQRRELDRLLDGAEVSAS
jgi:hypothetical protein